jgi:uncharacterized protein
LTACGFRTRRLPLVIPRHADGFSVQVFWDSDVGKWIEAASYALAHRRDAEIEAIVDDLGSAQAADGYLNCWYLCREPQNRWTNLRDNHELYNVGHLLEGAVAYFQTTGRRRFLDIMERCLDHIRATFGTGPGQKRGYCGHPEIELALVKHFRVTGDRRSLNLARYFVDERGAAPHYFDQEAQARGEDPGAFTQKTHEYSQSHLPVRQQTKVVGHAVRAMYLLFRDGRSCRLDRRRQPRARLRDAVGRSASDQDVCHGRDRSFGQQRRLHPRL